MHNTLLIIIPITFVLLININNGGCIKTDTCFYLINFPCFLFTFFTSFHISPGVLVRNWSPKVLFFNFKERQFHQITFYLCFYYLYVFNSLIREISKHKNIATTRLTFAGSYDESTLFLFLLQELHLLYFGKNFPSLQMKNIHDLFSPFHLKTARGKVS